MELYKIEKGIPVPQGYSGERARFVQQLEPGDSFVTKRGGVPQLSTLVRRRGLRMVTRTVDADHRRCWVLAAE